MGALATDDRADGRRVDITSPLFGDRAEIGVARVQRQIGHAVAVDIAAMRETVEGDSLVPDQVDGPNRLCVTTRYPLEPIAALAYVRVEHAQPGSEVSLGDRSVIVVRGA